MRCICGATCLVFALLLAPLLPARAQTPAIVGRWNMTVHAPRPYPSWFEVTEQGGQLQGRFVGAFGHAMPLKRVEFADGRVALWLGRRSEEMRNAPTYTGTLKGDIMEGVMRAREDQEMRWTAVRAPELKRTGKPVWGRPVELFNGQDLTGWQSLNPARNGWAAEGGLLVNRRPGTNLRTEQTFTDFKLRAEFRYPKGSNSGIYLRGRYEVQIEDGFGKPPHNRGIGSIYGFLEPRVNACREPGEWQTLDITLIGRIVTVVLNGQTLIDAQEIPGITGGALDSDEAAPGPIYLQGDHGPIEFRKITLTPATATDTPSAERRASMDRFWVYIGTYTGGKSKGIYLFEMDMATGALKPHGVVGEVADPSFLALHPNSRFLYAVNEIGDFQGTKSGAVSAFALDAKTGRLTFLNQQSSRGSGPCHLVVDRAGKNVLVANYGGGSVAVLPIGADGRLGEATAFVQHEGKSANPQRQEGPHAHAIQVDPANRFALSPDLGLDKILIYRFDAAQGALTPNQPPAAAVAPGAGPRHLAFHPSGRFAYVINELNSTVTAFEYDAERGALKEIQSLSTLPEGFHGVNWTAEVQAHPSGKFLYGSNRGHDSIALFAIDAETGRLRYIGCEPTQGKTPRNFGIDPTGTYLIAANQQSDTLVVFRIDSETGRLTPTGQTAEAPMPVCVKFLPVAN